VSGTGERTAESYDGEKESAPLLHIMYKENTTVFVRGDANASGGGVDITDAVSVLAYLFAGGKEPECYDAADANDDGAVDVSDTVSILLYLFSGENSHLMPFAECGADETRDQLPACDYPEQHCD
jgi:hypothetical protein